jgi:hypothetical protein
MTKRRRTNPAPLSEAEHFEALSGTRRLETLIAEIQTKTGELKNFIFLNDERLPGTPTAKVLHDELQEISARLTSLAAGVKPVVLPYPNVVPGPWTER